MQHSEILKASLLTAAILSMAACQNWKQPAATVEDGTNTVVSSGNVVTTTLPDNNPYGTAPINNPYGTSNTAPYTPPAATGGAYVGNYAPVDPSAVYHTVVSGDTVYNITKRYGITQDQLRSWNNMADNNVRLNTRLRVKPTDYVASASSTPVQTWTPPATTTVVTQPTTQPVVTTAPPVVNNVTHNNTPTTTTTTNSSTRSVSGITWMRPTQGNIITQFTTLNKGVDIAGNAGQNVVAAADGKVVYSGSDLRGYGNLVIVQHNATYLTAYGHNQKLLVKENDNVKRGQTIAHLGNTHADRYKLHFEVRQNGKPVNPLDYIPN